MGVSEESRKFKNFAKKSCPQSNSLTSQHQSCAHKEALILNFPNSFVQDCSSFDFHRIWNPEQ